MEYTPTPEPSAVETLSAAGYALSCVAAGLFFFAVAAGLVG